MPNGDTGAEELWAWLQEPLRQVRTTAAETPWEEVREELLRGLGLPDPAGHPVTRALFERLDELDEARRAELLVSDELEVVAYEIVLRVAAEQAREVRAEQVREGGGYDEAAWHEYVATNLAQWNGEESAWPAFREWFGYHAAERGLGEPATALLAYFDAMDTASRIAAFAQYGVTIVPPAAESAVAEAEQIAGTEQAGEAGAGESGAGPALDATTEAVMAEIIAANPEFAGLSEERRRELAAEVLREQEEVGA